jgi:hypothetical protein
MTRQGIVNFFDNYGFKKMKGVILLDLHHELSIVQYSIEVRKEKVEISLVLVRPNDIVVIDKPISTFRFQGVAIYVILFQ